MLPTAAALGYAGPAVPHGAAGIGSPRSGQRPHTSLSAAFLRLGAQFTGGRAGGGRKARRCSTGTPTLVRSAHPIGVGMAVTYRNWSNDMATELSVREQRTIFRALRILETRFKQPDVQILSATHGRDYLRLRFAGNVREELHILWLDAHNCLIEAETLFVGSLTQTSVYPREIVRAAIRHNAAAAILAHNHPSGNPSPSGADIELTSEVKKSLALIGVRVLDHIVVTERKVASLAEQGYV